MQGKISAKDVGFKINNDIQLLEEVSFDLNAGNHLALIGFSGSGKSTLSHLVSQLMKYTNGSIQIDGHEIKDLSKLDIASNISTVAQHPFIFTGTVRDNLLYSCEALHIAGKVDSLPDRTTLIAMLREVGLVDDVLRWGFRSIIPPQKASPMVDKFLMMRRIIHETLRPHFTSAVEFYDADAFLEYSTIGKNIIFGEYTDNNSPDYLITKKTFRSFLKSSELESTLYKLGLNIAETTINLLSDLRDDEFFFQGSPMEQEHFDEYARLIEKLKTKPIDRLKEKEKNRILSLALLYIPGKHKIYTISDSLRQTILQARHLFLKEVENVNVEQCIDGTIQKEIIQMDMLQKPVASTYDSTFIPFCSSQYLNNHSLRDNILFGTVIDRDAIRDELGELAVSHFSEQGLLDEILEIGLDFHVGSKGDRLSGGQKQKLALARSLLKQTPILILDEATASLDNTSQARIQKYIESTLKGNTTVIAVVHRLDMISGYDHIIVMKEGKIVESGKYEELLQQKGVLYGLVSEN